MHLKSRFAVHVAQASTAGLKPRNEDCIGIQVPDEPLLTVKGMVAVIADGVSSAEAGKEASETCVRNFISDYLSTPDAWCVKTSAQKVLTALNRWLYGQGQHFIEAHKGYISTLSILVVKSRIAHIFHIGDSRIYRLRAGEFEQLTQDHSAWISQDKAYLTRAMGMDLHLDVDYLTVDVEAGDRFLLTTDGVHDFLSFKQLRKQVRAFTDLEAGCQSLIDIALSQGSDDNLSCQLVDIIDVPNANAEDVYKKLSDLPFPPFLQPGCLLDGLKVVETLHESARSQIYLVEDLSDSQQCVLKTPSVNYDDDPAYIERFIMESWIGTRVENPHVAPVIKSDRVRSVLYYLSEYVPGIALSEWIKRHPKPALDDVLALFFQMVKGVRALHRKEILHQDIKPDNLIITDEGVVRIIDFGSCRVAGIAEIDTPFQRDRILGTATYSAPEQILNDRGTERSDQFSLAVCLYEMLTGQHPYGAKYEACRSLQDFSRLRYQPAYELHPMVPVWMDGVMRKALQINPDLRYNALSELTHDLQHPNMAFMGAERRPLLERNPLKFWKAASVLLAGIELVTLWLWLG